MKIYQVGGSVRDILRGEIPTDNDYVIVGSNTAQMLSLGYHQVGKNFPVFIHPQTKDEYALARREIKTGVKHTDFEFIFNENVTLEQDLERRDFTCNAIAKDIESGEITDPFNGRQDIKDKIIRHINTDSFQEDPLRILRMCRFAAQLDFEIAPQTMELAKNMVSHEMLNDLSAERIWKEIEKALTFPAFYKFIEAARECGALKKIMPAIDRLWSTPERLQYHPEGNTGAHTILTLEAAKNDSPKVKFAVLIHDIGKSTTPHDILPGHKGHDSRGLALIDEICSRLKIPNQYCTFAKIVCKNHMKLRQVPQMRLSTLIDFTDDMGKDLEDFIIACRADMLGRLRDIPQTEIETFENSANMMRKIYAISQTITASDMADYESLPKDKHFGEIYRNYRIKKIEEALKL